jgi:hypothetical protein
MHLVFLDTEFTDFIDPRLISIGLASSEGHEFYDEVVFPSTSCSDFVKKVVVPLLSCGERISQGQLGAKVLDWLNRIRNAKPVVICYDSDYDRVLFFSLYNNNPPSFLIFRSIPYHSINGLRRYEFFSMRGLAEHHALNDAMALRHAFRGWTRLVR